jgi:hypothetical protein
LAKAELYEYDEFISGNNTNPTWKLGWILNGGTSGQVAAEAGRPGLVSFNTGTATGTVAGARLRSSQTTGVLLPAEYFDMTFIIRPTNADANTTFRFGMVEDTTASSSVDCICFERYDGESNWKYVTRVASVETRTDSGIAIDTTTWLKMRVRRINSTTIGFTINNDPEVAQNSNIPTVAQNITIQVKNSTGASKGFHIDYFDLAITNLNR